MAIESYLFEISFIENYENHPAFSFIKEVPVDWQTTEVIDEENLDETKLEDLEDEQL